MKRIIILLTFCFLSICSYAGYNSITIGSYVKYTENGVEIMAKHTSLGSFFRQTCLMRMQMKRESLPDQDSVVSRYYFYIEPITMDETLRMVHGGKILLKTSKDEVFSFSNSMKGVEKIYSSETGIWRDWADHEKHYVDNGLISYKNVVRCEMSPEIIDKIIRDGLVKIRIETNKANVDIDIPPTEVFKINGEKKPMNTVSWLFSRSMSFFESILDPAKDL